MAGSAAARQGFAVSNPDYAPSSPVLVHQDAGRVPEDHDREPEREIPPTYDSIPLDDGARRFSGEDGRPVGVTRAPTPGGMPSLDREGASSPSGVPLPTSQHGHES
ncbi:hypothetical protein EXIGLDRAFT_767699 [Exidia glandulosa HHB12029]|uniref:Uncharacterized protein n=1 Tax=Exidia glandulosa HHB12029 TaxID=1314781 RepID=A0A165ISY9_EXIGL|nr:hypothetical protein EXIGLDRAFT_767699 [Exidia glandulosa HHB12029]